VVKAWPANLLTNHVEVVCIDRLNVFVESSLVEQDRDGKPFRAPDVISIYARKHEHVLWLMDRRYLRLIRHVGVGKRPYGNDGGCGVPPPVTSISGTSILP